jgi:two-component system response regulator
VATPRILVVEDEFIVALEMKVALEGMGFEVCGMVGTGKEALEVAVRERPDCVLMDVSLKGDMDGIEAARDIRARLGIPSVFMSGFPVEEMMERTADIRPMGCFVKPVAYEQLEAVLAEYFLSGEARPS